MAKYKIMSGFIIEVETDQKIVSFSKKKEAIGLCNFLNSGGGFDGFTPSFFLKPYLKKQ